MFELNCLGNRIFGYRRRISVLLCRAGKLKREKPLTGGGKASNDRRQHLQTSIEDISGFGKEEKVAVRDMLKARGAALRAGFWSQVGLASMGKLGGWEIAREAREWLDSEGGGPTTTTTARRGRLGRIADFNSLGKCSQGVTSRDGQSRAWTGRLDLCRIF